MPQKQEKKPEKDEKNEKRKTERPTRNVLKTTILPNLDKIEKWAGEGATMGEIAKKLRIGYSTLKRHFASTGEDSEPLRAALLTGRAVADDAVEANLYRRACGYTKKVKVWEDKLTKNGDVVRLEKQVLVAVPPDTTAATFWLTNRRPDEWRYKPGDGKDETGVFGVIEMPAVLAPDADSAEAPTDAPEVKHG